MRAVRATCLVVFAGVLSASSFGAGPPARPNQPAKKHHHVIRGEVIEVDRKDEKGQGLIKVRVHHKGQNPGNGQNANQQSKKKDHVVTVRVNKNTGYEFVIYTGKDGLVKDKLAHFSDVLPGEHVRIKVNGNHHAEEVSIIENKGKKK